MVETVGIETQMHNHLGISQEVLAECVSFGAGASRFAVQFFLQADHLCLTIR